MAVLANGVMNSIQVRLRPAEAPHRCAALRLLTLLRVPPGPLRLLLTRRRDGGGTTDGPRRPAALLSEGDALCSSHQTFGFYFWVGASTAGVQSDFRARFSGRSIQNVNFTLFYSTHMHQSIFCWRVSGAPVFVVLLLRAVQERRHLFPCSSYSSSQKQETPAFPTGIQTFQLL